MYTFFSGGTKPPKDPQDSEVSLIHNTKRLRVEGGLLQFIIISLAAFVAHEGRNDKMLVKNTFNNNKTISSFKRVRGV